MMQDNDCVPNRMPVPKQLCDNGMRVTPPPLPSPHPFEAPLLPSKAPLSPSKLPSFEAQLTSLEARLLLSLRSTPSPLPSKQLSLRSSFLPAKQLLPCEAPSLRRAPIEAGNLIAPWPRPAATLPREQSQERTTKGENGSRPALPPPLTLSRDPPDTCRAAGPSGAARVGGGVEGSKVRREGFEGRASKGEGFQRERASNRRRAPNKELRTREGRGFERVRRGERGLRTGGEGRESFEQGGREEGESFEQGRGASNRREGGFDRGRRGGGRASIREGGRGEGERRRERERREEASKGEGGGEGGGVEGRGEGRGGGFQRGEGGLQRGGRRGGFKGGGERGGGERGSKGGFKGGASKGGFVVSMTNWALPWKGNPPATTSNRLRTKTLARTLASLHTPDTTDSNAQLLRPNTTAVARAQQ